MSSILEQLKSYFESEEGKEDIKRENEKIKLRKEREDKYIQYLYNLSLPDRTALFEKIKAKYESIKYYNREIKLGREPRELLYDYILEYGHRYGISNDILDAHFGYDSYIIDGIWIITAWYGQGTCYNFDKLLIL
jgi:hypothetical protein